MVKDIVKGNQIFLKAEDMTTLDLNVVTDLIDTFNANRKNCVGLAANMIGYNKRAIIFEDQEEKKIMVMLNPVITKMEFPYNVSEGCLSLDEMHNTKRYRRIKVEYYDVNFKLKKKSYSGFTAEVIQHEIDHTNGIII
jgi:peptide deformylase